MNKIHVVIISVFFCAFVIFSVNAQNKPEKKSQYVINLAGDWGFQIDSLSTGIKDKWYERELEDHIGLPGSMTTNLKGYDITLGTPWTGSIVDSSYFKKPQYAKYRQPGNIKVPFWLQPVKYYKGAAWYQKMVDIPRSWTGKHLELYLERAHWETIVWIDGQQVGMQNSLSTSQIYDISRLLKPGNHRITIRVDNSIKEINVGENSHSITDHTQTNWNGIIGRIYLKARPAIFIDDIQVYPDIASKRAVIKVKIVNNTSKKTNINLNLSALSNDPAAKRLKSMNRKFLLIKNENIVKLVYPMGSSPLLWNEFHPNLYRLFVKLASGTDMTDQTEKTFGMRNFSSDGTSFTINGQPTLLRGTLECAAYPKTGYPPTDIQSWIEEFKTCKAFGLNHLRFHSWCPPEAAFQAADSLGMYLQVECSSWANDGVTIGDGKPLDEYLYRESRAIVKAYGNHPSFCMLAYGNEPAGKNLVSYLRNFVIYWKAKDSRRLYTTGAGWPVIDESDYNSSPDPRIQHWDEGLKSIINYKKPSTDYDWSAIIAKWRHPTVSHEIGQWCVYPDFDEISKYNGVLKAKNFEIFRDQLKQNGLSEFEHDFLIGSGKLQTLCYKADIEAALRTKGFGGFQLLGLSDFPGQGTALVGVLNAFWKEKTYMTAQEFKQFCNAVVPLARFPKMIYLNNEELDVPVEIAQYGKEVINEATPTWKITNNQGQVMFRGNFEKKNIPFGNGISLGKINQGLSSISSPSKLTVTVNVAGYENSWDIFVYPSHLQMPDREILVTQKLDSNALRTLAKGGKVLLTIKKGDLAADKGGDIAIGFSTIFWNTAWTNGQPPVTMGIWCDPKHPAFSNFPTEAFSNWQWWDAMTHSSPIKLDSVSTGLKPIIRVIDDWVTARFLGLIFECRIGRGKLLVSGIDLLTNAADRPEARQLLYSLENYMKKDEFSPNQTIDVKKIRALCNLQR